MDFGRSWHRLRRTITSTWILLPGIGVSACAWAQSDAVHSAAPDAVALVEQFSADVADLTASFRQTIFDGDGELLEESAGRFLLLRPNRFAWYYDTPEPVEIVADGESLWMYDVEIEQITVAPLSDDLAESPAMLLSGEGNVSENFLVSELVSDDERRWIQLLPKTDDGEFSSARLGFSDGVPEIIELVDGLSRLTRIEFSEIEVNSGLRRRDFDFDPPDGVDVIGDD